MDIATHVLVSLALWRGFFPRRGWAVAAGMLVAGMLADVDAISALFGPNAYLNWHGTYTHSLVGALAIVGLTTILVVQLDTKKTQTIAGISVAMAVAAVAHLLLDVCRSEGVTLLWPLRSTRFAGDLLPSVDAWILALLILGLVTPELFRLVSSEIGAKDKTPHGRNGAIVALALILIYAGARFVLHANAAAELDAHSYRGESPRKVGAFADPDFDICMAWNRGDAISCLPTGSAGGPGRPFNPEAATCQHKPEPSPALDLAQQTATAREFLRVARFQKQAWRKRKTDMKLRFAH